MLSRVGDIILLVKRLTSYVDKNKKYVKVYKMYSYEVDALRDELRLFRSIFSLLYEEITDYLSGSFFYLTKDANIVSLFSELRHMMVPSLEYYGYNGILQYNDKRLPLIGRRIHDIELIIGSYFCSSLGDSKLVGQWTDAGFVAKDDLIVIHELKNGFFKLNIVDSRVDETLLLVQKWVSYLKKRDFYNLFSELKEYYPDSKKEEIDEFLKLNADIMSQEIDNLNIIHWIWDEEKQEYRSEDGRFYIMKGEAVVKIWNRQLDRCGWYGQHFCRSFLWRRVFIGGDGSFYKRRSIIKKIRCYLRYKNTWVLHDKYSHFRFLYGFRVEKIGLDVLSCQVEAEKIAKSDFYSDVMSKRRSFMLV